MKKRYGSLFRFDLGHVPTIFLSDYDDIVASSNTEELLGKPFDNLSPIIDIKGRLYPVQCPVPWALDTVVSPSLPKFTQSLQDRMLMENLEEYSSARVRPGRSCASLL